MYVSLLLVFVPGILQAQRPAPDYPVRLYPINSNDGLSQGFVPAIIQDSRGFIWFATKDGLNKYDGYRFTVYRHDAADPHSLPDNFVGELVEDSRGYLWVVTPGKLCVFDPVTELFYRLDLRHRSGETFDGMHRLTEDADGNMWFRSRQEHVCVKLAPGKDPASDVFTEKYTAVVTFEKELLAKYKLAGTISEPFYFDAEGGMWMTIGDSLYYVAKKDQAAGKITRRHKTENFFGWPGCSLHHIASDKKHRTIYFITTSGIAVYDLVTSSMEKKCAWPIRHFSFRQGFDIDENRNAWLNINDTTVFLEYATGSFRKLAPVNIETGTWRSYGVEAVLVDRSGIVWMGTNGYGVFKYNPNVAKFHLSETGAMGWINGTRDGRIVFETKHGPRQFDPYTQRPAGTIFTDGIFFHHINGADDHSPRCFIQDRKGIFWLGYGNGHLAQYDEQRQNIRFYYVGGNDSGRTSATRLWLDADGYPWMLVENIHSQTSIYRFDPETETFSAPAYFPEMDGRYLYAIVSAVLVSPQGDFWFGTTHGLYCFSPKTKTWKEFHHVAGDPSSLSNDQVFSLCFDPAQPGNFLWVGTNSGGLNRLDMTTGTFTCYTDKDGLPNNVIYGILSDNSGNLWISTNRGLCRFNPSTKECKSFYASDGLQNNEFNRYSYYKAPDGALYFGGVSGLNFFYPEQINTNGPAPSIVFTGLRLFNDEVSYNDPGSPIRKPLDYLDGIVLNYDQDVIALEFAAMDFSAPEKNQFRYMLEGFDKDWTFSGTRNEAIYTGLVPGEYSFVVEAANSQGVWTTQGRTLRIVVLPPWWQTWWARTLYVVVGAGLVLLFLWLRTAGLRKRQKQLEEKVRERTQELNESITFLRQTQDQLVQNEKLASFGQLTAGIAHEIKNPLNFINNFSELSHELIEELKEARSDEERNEILESLKSNLSKINHHGSRVDSIIKSMLAHSRGAGAVKQITDVNKLCEEYTNLAYHSMRANVQDFTCHIKKQLDPTLPGLYAIPQDISRVLLNLLNNAFYAVNERRKVSGPDYRPELVIATTKEDGSAVITVRDNGSGIPESVKRKLFTPFFTTKPAGEGTGLGLSISADIVEAHGGTLQVDSRENEFTEFTIRIPLRDPEQVSRLN